LDPFGNVQILSASVGQIFNTILLLTLLMWFEWNFGFTGHGLWVDCLVLMMI